MLDSPDRAIRFYLFYGQDESQSRGHGDRLLKGLGAEKFAVTAQAAKADPALLADEASAIGLFGGKRAIWVEPVGDDIVPAIEALLGTAATESPVVAIAGALRKASPLVKLAEADPRALAHISYDLSDRDAEQLVEELARAEGLRLASGIAGRIAAAAGNDRGIIAQELAKFALFLAASLEDPKSVERDTLELVGAGSEGDWSRLADLAISGDLTGLSREIDSARSDADPITIVRALQRRLLTLAPIRAAVEHGQRPHDAVTSAGKSVFGKDKDVVTRLISLWDAEGLARILERSGVLERRLMQSDSPPPADAVEEELVAIARMARRR